MTAKIKSKLIIVFCFLLSICTIFTSCKSYDNGAITIYSSTGKYVLIESFSPNNACSYFGGSIVIVGVKSKLDTLKITAELSGQSITLTKDAMQGGGQDATDSEIYNYSGSFTLPHPKKDTALGQVKFTCVSNGTTEIYYSGIITVLKSGDGQNSSDIGERYVAEVVGVPAETFNGDTVDDTSLPTNNYLPVGTVDYCSSTPIVNEGIEKSYRLLRYGKRVYDDQNIKVYEGKLPSTNSLHLDRCETDGKYTVISFFTDWKAPFTLELKEQEFIAPEKGDYRIKEATFSYIEIRFMYCDEIVANLEFDNYNPLFSKGEIKYEDNCAVMTLTLKEAGKFYGWRAEYDQDDCLVFRFLEPTRIYPAENQYGIGLYDKVIVVDAGHGGNDSGGAEGGLKESNSNLSLAFILEEELEAAGATVIMTRRDDTSLNTYERYAKVLETEPDFLISIHRNGGGSNGFGSYYFNPYSASPANYIYKETWKAQLYRRSNGTMWHYFFLNRLGICPSVLTENGFLDDDSDRANMQNADHQRACAKALVKGIAEYFKSQHS